MDTQLVLTEKEAARALGLSTRTLERLRKKGELRYFNVGNRVRYRLEALQAWARSKEEQVTAELSGQ